MNVTKILMPEAIRKQDGLGSIKKPIVAFESVFNLSENGTQNEVEPVGSSPKGVGNEVDSLVPPVSEPSNDVDRNSEASTGKPNSVDVPGMVQEDELQLTLTEGQFIAEGVPPSEVVVADVSVGLGAIALIDGIPSLGNYSNYTGRPASKTGIVESERSSAPMSALPETRTSKGLIPTETAHFQVPHVREDVLPAGDHSAYDSPLEGGLYQVKISEIPRVSLKENELRAIEKTEVQKQDPTQNTIRREVDGSTRPDVAKFATSSFGETESGSIPATKPHYQYSQAPETKLASSAANKDVLISDPLSQSRTIDQKQVNPSFTRVGAKAPNQLIPDLLHVAKGHSHDEIFHPGTYMTAYEKDLSKFPADRYEGGLQAYAPKYRDSALGFLNGAQPKHKIEIVTPIAGEPNEIFEGEKNIFSQKNSSFASPATNTLLMSRHTTEIDNYSAREPKTLSVVNAASTPVDAIEKTDFSPPSSIAHELSPTRSLGDTMAFRADAARIPLLQTTEFLIRHPDRTVEVFLNPRELGSVKMSITTGDGNLTLTLSVERGETLDLMRRHIDSLFQEFRKLGYTHVGIEFEHNGSNSQERNRENNFLLYQPNDPDETDLAERRGHVPHSLLHSETGLDLRI